MNSNPPDRLVSWKEISAYLGIDERTCQRWEKKYGLPVRRIDPATKSRVFAFKTELDEWRERMSGLNGSFREDKNNGRPAPAADRTGRPFLFWAAGVFVILGGALILLLAIRSPIESRPIFGLTGLSLLFSMKPAMSYGDITRN